MRKFSKNETEPELNLEALSKKSVFPVENTQINLATNIAEKEREQQIQIEAEENLLNMS